MQLAPIEDGDGEIAYYMGCQEHIKEETLDEALRDTLLLSPQAGMPREMEGIEQLLCCAADAQALQVQGGLASSDVAFTICNPFLRDCPITHASDCDPNYVQGGLVCF